MFTGIVTDLATIAEIAPGQAAKRFRLKTAYDLKTVDIGASIACNGCCLTVIEKGVRVLQFKNRVRTVDGFDPSVIKVKIGRAHI